MPPKVLVAEDEPLSRRLLRAQLESAGYDVVTAENGARAWEIFQNHRKNHTSRTSGKGAGAGSSEWVSSWATSGGREGRTDAFKELAGMAWGAGQAQVDWAMSSARWVLELGLRYGEPPQVPQSRWSLSAAWSPLRRRATTRRSRSRRPDLISVTTDASRYGRSICSTDENPGCDGA